MALIFGQPRIVTGRVVGRAETLESGIVLRYLIKREVLAAEMDNVELLVVGIIKMVRFPLYKIIVKVAVLRIGDIGVAFL